MDITTFLKANYWDNFNYELYLEYLKAKSKLI
jgi:hypothetical protein